LMDWWLWRYSHNSVVLFNNSIKNPAEAGFFI